MRNTVLPRLSLALMLALPVMVQGHVTPPTVFISDREAVVSLTKGATTYVEHRVELTPGQRATMASRWGWSPEQAAYRFYEGRASGGRRIGAVVFLTAFTTHGPMRAAIAISPDGKVADARIVEVATESADWVRPLMDGIFVRSFAGLDSQGDFSARASQAAVKGSMPRFYGTVFARLIQRAAILFDVAGLKQPAE